MISSAINNLKRAILVLNDLPKKVDENKKTTLSSLNDIFEDFIDQFDKDKDKATLKKITKLRLEVMSKVEDLCLSVSDGLHKEIKMVEE